MHAALQTALSLVAVGLAFGEGEVLCDLRVPAQPGALHFAAQQLRGQLQSAEDRDLTVCLEGGDHALGGAPLRLDGSHNHPAGRRVVWRPVPGAPAPPRLSAGVALDRWQRCEDVPNACGGGLGSEWGGVWVHQVQGLPNVTAADVPFRQLWVAGRRAARRSLEGSALGLQTTSTGYVASRPEMISTAWVQSQVEMRWPSQIMNWIEPRCPIVSTSGANLTVQPQCWALLTARNGGKQPPPPAFVENVPGPPGPGEFSATQDHVFYRPLAYEEPSDAIAPLGGAILEGSGLANHSFVGLGFSHGSWRPTAGFVDSQTLVVEGPDGTVEPDGAVSFKHVRGLVVESCSFRNIGTAYALAIGDASQGVEVTKSNFEDLSGGAVKLGNVLNDTRAVSTDRKDFDTDYLLQDCSVTTASVEFRGGAAVFAGYVARTQIMHNTISDTGYTGISLGWGWGTHVTGPQTFAADNRVAYNRLTGIMSALNDGGCIYTLGPQPRSAVDHNYCHSDRAPVVGCFYHDNGSRYFGTSFNVADGSPAPCVYLQGCCNSPAYDIAVTELWCRSTAPVQNGCAAQNCTIDSTTLFVVQAGAAWPAAAQLIVDAAGARTSAEPATIDLVV